MKIYIIHIGGYDESCESRNVCATASTLLNARAIAKDFLENSINEDEKVVICSTILNTQKFTTEETYAISEGLFCERIGG